MTKKQGEELKNRSRDELEQRRRSLVAELITTKKQRRTAEIRREIARIATRLRQKEMNNETT